ncbi:Platelet-activating factor acetylhydrolase [Thoreauomyces humboldtii]|nr:Platelet-activating factor acetylhydrolase [Thoreauomyces humboldtii]
MATAGEPSINLAGATASSFSQSKGSWFTSWLPSLPDYQGPYPVGVTDIETPADPATGAKGVLVRLYYPTTLEETRRRSRAKWLPRAKFYAMGYANFSKLPALVGMGVFLPALAGIKTPAFLDAALHPAGSSSLATGECDANAKKTGVLPPLAAKLPPVIFSHGLGGMRTTYSTFCGNLASEGFLVAAIEHRDGSASVSAQNNYNDKIIYKVPDEKHLAPGQSVDEYLLTLRTGQVRLKAGEVKEAIQIIRDLNQGTPVTNLMASSTTSVDSSVDGLDIARSLTGRIDLEAWVMAGHSFGAATALTALQDPDNPFKVGIALDPWMHAVDATLHPSVPFMSVQSHHFQWKANLDPLAAFFHRPSSSTSSSPSSSSTTTAVTTAARETSRFGVLKDTAHQDVSDFPALFPSLMRKIKLGGEMDPTKSLELVHRWHMQFLKETVGERVEIEMKTHPGFEKVPSVERPEAVVEGEDAFDLLYGTIRKDWK